MGKYNWLPSEILLLDDLVDKMTAGHRILLYTPFLWEVEKFCDELEGMLVKDGGKCIVFDATSITKNNMKSRLNNLKEDAYSGVDEYGLSIIIVKKYGEALRNSQVAEIIHATLYELLIDGQKSSDISSILFAHTGDPLFRGFRDSPLIGRLDALSTPKLSTEDAESIGRPLGYIKKDYGDCTIFARNELRQSYEDSIATAELHLRANLNRIYNDAPSEVRVFLNSDGNIPSDKNSQRWLSHYGFISSGRYYFSNVADRAGLPGKIISNSWPNNRDKSLEKFIELIGDSSSVYWIDRYIFSPHHIQQSLKFIKELDSKINCDIKILTSGVDQTVQQRVNDSSKNLNHVEIRVMRRGDFGELHDRHLVSIDKAFAYNIPMCSVIFSTQAPGTATTSPFIPEISKYHNYWNRGQRL